MNEFLRSMKHYQQISRLEGISQILWWDMETVMPTDSADERAEQLGVLAAQIQRMWLDPEFYASVKKVQESLLSVEEKAQLEKLATELGRRRAITVDFAEREAKLQSICQHEWKEARSKNDFRIVQKTFTEVVQHFRDKAALYKESPDLKKRYEGLDDFSILFDSLEPGFRSQELGLLFKDLEAGLRQRIPKFLERQPPGDGLYPLPVERQRTVFSKLPELFGLNRKRSRLDESTHPFCGGARGDIRITTRYSERDALSSMYGVIHETGHALYEQGLPRALWHTPVGNAASFGIHESQSRFLENQIGRSEAFCSWLSKESGLDSQRLLAASRRVKPGFIRVSADEVTYNLHIILRWKIEKDLLSGKLPVAQLSERWRSDFEQMMGMKVDTESNGCLQDIHWYGGAFSYFPTYTIGNLLAAELYVEFGKEMPNWKSEIENGNLIIVRDFMDRKIYQQASLSDSPETIRKALGGRNLGCQAFLNYLDERYS